MKAGKRFPAECKLDWSPCAEKQSPQETQKKKTMKTFRMHNFATGKTVTKTQKSKPKLKGYVCVASERDLPEANSRGERLFRDANNCPYYASVHADGSHYQP